MDSLCEIVSMCECVYARPRECGREWAHTWSTLILRWTVNNWLHCACACTSMRQMKLEWETNHIGGRECETQGPDRQIDTMTAILRVERITHSLKLKVIGLSSIRSEHDVWTRTHSYNFGACSLAKYLPTRKSFVTLYIITRCLA